MKIVIEIDDARFKDIRRIACVQFENYHFKTVEQIIANGTPLPKGHGRLIDADKLHHCECKGNFSECDTCLSDDLCNLVNNTPTIIEADKE